MTKAGKIVSLIILLALVIPLTSLSMPESAFSAVGITNGGFETGDFTGWDVNIAPGGYAQVVEKYEDEEATYSAKEGNYFALLVPGQEDVYTVVSQPFTADVGSRISGWAFFKTTDYMPYNDGSMVEITVNSGGRVLATVFRASVSTVGDYDGTPWTHWSYILPRGGEYTIQAKVNNFLDSSVPSYLGLDGVSIIRVPTQQKPKSPSRTAATPALILTKYLDIDPEKVYSGQPITISANMANDGDNPGGYTADLKINGQTEQLKIGDVDGHSSVPVMFTLSRSQPGTYTVDLSGQKGTFTVLAPKTTPSSPASSPAIAIIIICVMVLCAAGILMLALRRPA